MHLSSRKIGSGTSLDRALHNFYLEAKKQFMVYYANLLQNTIVEASRSALRNEEGYRFIRSC